MDVFVSLAEQVSFRAILDYIAIVPGESDILGLQASHRWLRGIAALRPMKFAGLAKTAYCEQTCFHTRRDP